MLNKFGTERVSFASLLPDASIRKPSTSRTERGFADRASPRRAPAPMGLGCDRALTPRFATDARGKRRVHVRYATTDCQEGYVHVNMPSTLFPRRCEDASGDL